MLAIHPLHRPRVLWTLSDITIVERDGLSQGLPNLTLAGCDITQMKGTPIPNGLHANSPSTKIRPSVTHGCSWVDWKDRDPRSSHSAMFNSSFNQGSGLERRPGEMSLVSTLTWHERHAWFGSNPWQNLDYQSRDGLLSSGAVEAGRITSDTVMCPAPMETIITFYPDPNPACHWGQRDVSEDKSRIALSEEPGLLSNTYMAAHSHMQLQFQGSSTLCWTPQSLGA